MGGRVIRFPQQTICSEEGEAIARRVLGTPLHQRASRSKELRLENPETLLSICERLRGQRETSPSAIRDEAEFFYRFLEKPKRPIGLFDEREYFLGEFALIAGTTCRHLSRRDEARLWFDRSESAFRLTANAAGDLSRLAYQRLALRTEERQFEAVLELVPQLVDSLQKLGMPDDALKARFLEGLSLMETDALEEAVKVFLDICAEARALKNERLIASAYGNLTHIYGMMGDPAKALESSRLAIPMLQKLDDRVALAKVQWGIATLLREIGQIPTSIQAYRNAKEEFQRIGMRADVAALSLVLADLLMEIGQDHKAMLEVLSALPIIDELKMVPEGMAALSLLRESVRQRRINREALRDLHGYFEDLKS